MRKIFIMILVVTLAVLLFQYFGKKEESLPDQAAKKVDEITTQASDTVVKKIRTPLNKSRGTKDLGDERTDAIDKAMQDQ